VAFVVALKYLADVQNVYSNIGVSDAGVVQLVDAQIRPICKNCQAWWF
jgi:hypothetical protein